LNTIRVLVANRPRLMRELVMTTISDQPDIEIVGEVPEESEIEKAIERTRPDFLIVGLEEDSDRLPNICQEALRSHPHMRVIAIAPNRDRLMFYSASFRIQSDQLEASEASVLKALRGHSQPSGRVQ
jgi:DNA-binding NarL/FixJ family response regulator